MVESRLEGAQLEALFAAADRVRERAWSPYSGLSVGAALLCSDGSIVAGCNVENASYGLTICAERAAVCSALAAGKREFVAIAITGNRPDPLLPCGACRQVLAEFSQDLIVVARGAGDPVRTTLAELLPQRFGAADLAPGPGVASDDGGAR